ncbi:MAG: hypothetical protein GY793_04105 [Proteobacteria bacterium]|nr:hypothetical protein [Pseudomonadota bacterium]
MSEKIASSVIDNVIEWCKKVSLSDLFWLGWALSSFTMAILCVELYLLLIVDTTRITIPKSFFLPFYDWSGLDICGCLERC